MNDLLRPALYDAWHRIEAVRPSGSQRTANVVGPVCETGDTFATARQMDAVEAGDLVVFRTAGAYAAAMGAAEARHDRFSVFGDLTFIHLDANQGIGIRDPDFLEAELDSRTAEITLLGGYSVVNDGPVRVDLMAGGRMNFFKVTLQLDGPNRSANGSKKESWFDPLIGTRIQAPLGGKWGMDFYGDLGGIVMTPLPRATALLLNVAHAMDALPDSALDELWGTLREDALANGYVPGKRVSR